MAGIKVDWSKKIRIVFLVHKFFRLSVVICFIAVSVIAGTACSPEVPGQPTASDPENPAIITDRTGRDWDVTKARDTYGMNPDYFNYGLGIGAISSVDNPIIYEEGDPGYPTSDSSIRVFGIDHNGEQRAYSIDALIRHEVFNVIYPGESDQYLAVTY